MPYNRPFKVSASFFNTQNNPQFDTYDTGFQLDYNTNREFTEESIRISGSPINIFAMIGIHQKSLMIDIAQNGYPLSGGTAAGYNAANAFMQDAGGWLSIQTGSDTSSAYIGYYFGQQMSELYPTMTMYEPDNINYSYRVQSFSLKNLDDPETWAQSILVQCSTDGKIWYSLNTVTILQDTNENVYSIESDGSFAYWRFMPVEFNSTNSAWGVNYISLYEQSITDLHTIEDMILLENRARNYARNPIFMKCFKTTLDIPYAISQFGIDISNNYELKFAYTDVIQKLGRTIVVGDIIDYIPEQQYTLDFNVNRRLLEVQDVFWDHNSYSANWTPTIINATCTVLKASQQTKDVTGIISDYKTYTPPTTDSDYSGIDISTLGERNNAAILTQANKDVPQTGTNTTDIYMTPQSKTNYSNADAKPCNGQEYTKGTAFPLTPTDGQFFVIQYDPSFNIADQLYQYSVANGLWIYQYSQSQEVQNSIPQGFKQLYNNSNNISADQNPFDIISKMRAKK